MFDRHLVLDMDFQTNLAVIACQTEPVPFDRTQHTLISAFAGCPACRAVQAARVVLIYADLNA
ncbi:hypothetical protein ACGFIW_01285 [Micromonospora sp. NPDC048935]|uniref:hypothetical protein n=1 Tax=Micromonospora sp. NPDC048935 TaxID=3364262 RepID=UPI003721FC27